MNGFDLDLSALLVHVLRTTAVLGVLALIARALRRAPASHQHRLWWLALLQLVLPAAWLAGLVPTPAREAAGVLELNLGAVLPGAEAGAESGFDPVPWLLLVWAVGAAILFWRLAASAGAAAGLLRRSRPAGAELRVAAEAAGIPGDALRELDGLPLPLVAGWLSPRIIAPADLAARLSDEELRRVLLHEEAHRRRRDPLRAAIARALAALLWWHPGVWWTLRRLDASAEYACDEAAAPDALHAEVLATALARSIRTALERGAPEPLPASLAGGSVPLRRRLLRLPCPRRSQSMKTTRLLLTGALLVVGAGVLLAAAEPPAPPAPVARPEPAAEPAPEVPPTALSEPVPAAAPEPAAAASRVAPAAPKADEPVKEKPVPKGKKKPGDPPPPPKYDVKPQLVKDVQPVYPPECKAEGVTGEVLLLVTIDAEGAVSDIKLINKKKVDKRLVKAVIKAVQQSRYAPAQLDGEPVESVVKVKHLFALS